MSSGGGGSIGSKLGFKGEEQLADGLKAGFDLEFGLETSSGGKGVPGSPDNVTLVPPGGAIGFDRRSTVSLVGAWGELRLGRDLAASFVNDVVYEPFLTYGVGSSLNFPLGVVADAKSAASLFRVSNAVSYFLPSGLGGVSGQLQVALGEQPSSAGAARHDGRYTGARLAYDAGPLSVSVSAGKATHSIGALGNDHGAANLGAAYDFGPVRVLGEYARFKVQNSTGVDGSDLRTRVITLGLVAPVGAGIVKLGHSRGSRELSGVAGEPRASKWALGYEHVLSKRSALYATLARVGNAHGAAVNVGDGAVAGLGGAVSSPNSSSTGYDIGLRHSF